MAARGAKPRRIDENRSFAEYLGESLKMTRDEIGHPSPGGDGYVGYDQLPTQVHTRSMHEGFTFNIMVVGETGLGKTTFLNTLFLRKLLPPRPKKDFEAPAQTLQVDPKRIELVENGVKLNLCLIDTPGFGGKINNEESWDPLIDYINAQFESFLKEETKPERQIPISDTRVHCCLYFVDPSGPAHGLKMLDVELMKRIHKKVNIIPVVAKADMMTRGDLEEFKKTVAEEVAFHEISVYQFPAEEGDAQVPWPFAVVGSTKSVTVGGEEVLGREYPWGVCEVENDNHSDFVYVRQMLIRKCMIDLIHRTSNDLYAAYRTEMLESGGFSEDLPTGDKPEAAAKPDVSEYKKKEAAFLKEKKELEVKWHKREEDLEARAEKLRKMVEEHKKRLEQGKKKA